MEFIKKFIELTRAYALLMTFASCIVVFAFAYYHPNFSFFNFFLLVLGLSCVHLGGNLFDDYVDVKKKLQEGYTLENMHFDSFTPKALLIRNGTFTFKQVEAILNILFSIALGVGICFMFFAGWKVLIFIALGAVLTLFYPISSRFYLSELIIGLIYGPLMIMGGYFALCADFNSSLLLLSFAIFISTLVLLHTHNIMDWEFDIKNHKNTLCILSGSKDKAIKLLGIMIFLCYAIIVLGVLKGSFNPNMLYVFLTLPIATKLMSSIREYVNIKDVEFKPRWYWGFFENWDEIQKNHIDFFMFRFYLARNFAFFFAVFAAIGVMV